MMKRTKMDMEENGDKWIVAMDGKGSTLGRMDEWVKMDEYDIL